MCKDYPPSQEEKECSCHSHVSKLPFIQPCLLLLLYEKPSHGYELMEKLLEFDLSLDAATVYRNLRKLEEEGLVSSQWYTQETGPARRLYKLTMDGEDMLHSWVHTIRRRKAVLEKFLKRYSNNFPNRSS
ncbi:MAG TPA: PadR family transcriptional regulator [Peptococcaceae bacterium]|nr:MAG: Transcriptional regulator, PadR-like family [Clostridia bacterium 41_269]HBT20335.1 PadR family transcriptional regulator [Peptococcaceae bacterium]